MIYNWHDINARTPRIRLLIGDTVALGPGKAKLLDIIDKTGSILAAAPNGNVLPQGMGTNR